MPERSAYTVACNDNRGRPVWSVMRGSIVLVRYYDQDVAYEVLNFLASKEYGETVNQQRR